MEVDSVSKFILTNCAGSFLRSLHRIFSLKVFVDLNDSNDLENHNQKYVLRLRIEKLAR